MMTSDANSRNPPVTNGNAELESKSDSSLRMSDARATVVAVKTTRNGPSTRANMRVRSSGGLVVLMCRTSIGDGSLGV